MATGQAEEGVTSLSVKSATGRCLLRAREVALRRRQVACVSTSDRPTAGQDWGQSRALVWFDVLRTLAFQAPDRLAHMSDTTSTIRL